MHYNNMGGMLGGERREGLGRGGRESKGSLYTISWEIIITKVVKKKP